MYLLKKIREIKKRKIKLIYAEKTVCNELPKRFNIFSFVRITFWVKTGWKIKAEFKWKSTCDTTMINPGRTIHLFLTSTPIAILQFYMVTKFITVNQIFVEEFLTEECDIFQNPSPKRWFQVSMSKWTWWLQSVSERPKIVLKLPGWILESYNCQLF